MINFRYHLVSLISVFLALAIGVVLGAGPLQSSLGNALSNQVSSLREDQRSAQSQLELAQAATENQDEYIAAAGAAVLPGTLADRAIALVTLPGAQEADIEALRTQLEAAGARVVSRVALTDAWADQGRTTFRDTYAGQFGGYLSGVSGAGNTVLGAGVATALTTEGANATALMDLLQASDSPLASVVTAPSAAAQGVVVVGPRSAVEAAAGGSGADADSTAEAADPQAWADALSGMGGAAPTVVVGAAGADTDVVTLLRRSSAPLSTVDSVGLAAASVNAPLAMAQSLAGSNGAWGFASGASAVMPPVAR